MALGLEASTLAPGTKDSVDPDEVKLAFAKASSLRTEAKAAHFEDTPVRGALTDRALEYAQKTNVQEKLATAVAARRALDRAAPGSVEKAAREHELQGAMQMLTAEIDKAKLLDKLTEKLTSGEHIPESFGAEVAAARNAIGARQDDADKELAAAGKLRGKHSQRAAEVEVGVQNLLGMFTPKGAVPSTTTADVAKEGEDPDAIWARMQNDGVRFARADVSPQIASTARYQGATSTNIRHDLSLMTDVLSSQRKEFEALTQKLEAILSKLDGVI
jgi:hypothetical protein